MYHQLFPQLVVEDSFLVRFHKPSIFGYLCLLLEIMETVLELPEAFIFLLFGYLKLEPLVFELIGGDQSRLDLIQ